jgi:hypothetical protein
LVTAQSYSTEMGSYSTLDGELQHTGWVKLNSGNATGRCRNIFEQNKRYQQYQTTLHF